MKEAILALDYGTTALKAVLCDEHFECIGTAAREWSYLYPQPGFIEHPAEAYWTAAVSAIRELTERYGAEYRVTCVSVTGQSETLMVMDADGGVLGNAIVWLDTRAQAECEQLAACWPAGRLYDATGNTGFDPVMPICKLMWMKKREPERYAAARTFLLIKEYIIYRLTGRMVGEYSAQSCSGYFNIRTCSWQSDLIEAAGLDADRLPEIRDSQYIVGPLCREAMLETGLGDGVKVVNGLLDQCASLLGAGAVDGSRITETTGTVLAIGATIDDFDGSAPDMLVLRHALKGRYLALPNCSTAGVLLKWFRDRFMPEGSDYDAINREIIARGRPESGLMLLPHFAGYLSPVNNARATGVIYGLSLDTERCDVAHAIMEGVGFLLRENLELLERRGLHSERIISLGGGAKSPLWLGIKANICGREMAVLEDDESTARGCAVNAGLALGMIGEADVPKLAAIRERFLPTEAGRELYEKKYRTYQALNARLGFNPVGDVIG